MKTKRILMSLLALSAALNLGAQTMTVKGTITDGATGATVP